MNSLRYHVISVVIIGDSVADSVADSVVSRRLSCQTATQSPTSRRPVVDQSPTRLLCELRKNKIPRY